MMKGNKSYSTNSKYDLMILQTVNNSEIVVAIYVEKERKLNEGAKQEKKKMG